MIYLTSQFQVSLFGVSYLLLIRLIILFSVFQYLVSTYLEQRDTRVETTPSPQQRGNSTGGKVFLVLPTILFPKLHTSVTTVVSTFLVRLYPLPIMTTFISEAGKKAPTAPAQQTSEGTIQLGAAPGSNSAGNNFKLKPSSSKPSKLKAPACSLL